MLYGESFFIFVGTAATFCLTLSSWMHWQSVWVCTCVRACECVCVCIVLAINNGFKSQVIGDNNNSYSNNSERITTTTTTSGCPTNRPIATTFHLKLTFQRSARGLPMELRLCLPLLSVRPWAGTCARSADMPQRGVVLFLDVSFALNSARLGDFYCAVSLSFLLIKKQTSLAWRCDVFFAFPLLLLSFLHCLSTDVTNARQCSTGLFMGLPQRYLHSSFGTAIEIDLLLFSLHVCFAFCFA